MDTFAFTLLKSTHSAGIHRSFSLSARSGLAAFCGLDALLVAIENEAVAVFVPIGIVTVNLHDFRNEATARPAFEMHDDVHGITNECLNRTVREIHATLQNTAGKAR